MKNIKFLEYVFLICLLSVVASTLSTENESIECRLLCKSMDTYKNEIYSLNCDCSIKMFKS